LGCCVKEDEVEEFVAIQDVSHILQQEHKEQPLLRHYKSNRK
jgi:hypothetical protein